MLVDAEIFDVDVAAEAGVEEQIPARVVVVVVDVNTIALPLPIAAAIEVVRSHDPVRIVIEHDAAGAVINAAGDKFCSHVLVPAIRVCATRANAIVIGIPVPMIIAFALLVPSFMLAVVVMIALIVAMFIPTFVLTVVVVVPVTEFRPDPAGLLGIGASAPLRWENYCGDALPMSFRMTLPEAGDVIEGTFVDLAGKPASTLGVARCDDASGPSTFTVYPFQEPVQ